ncbi:glycine zipper domain-containing protein [Aureimonas leprariae]|uniref:Glycine zipper domain-containing protein n=1 Tax=Plantimonas leprariae TaxID=2615207 RepID=A0A7V7PPG2_9HYPH|nr:hypothetical protein [Aureimonas leprariae]KAB0679865.1 hypothetical protein F6X38_11615 [Aureimonas leprariae]
MKKMLLCVSAVALIATAGCSQTDKDTALGAGAGGLIGAGIGGLAGGGRGALIGGALGAGTGAVAGNVISRNSRSGDCVYRDRNGRRYVAECP